MPNNYISLGAPPSGYVVDANTRLLMRFEGANGSGIFTDEVGHIVTKGGNAFIETGVPLEDSSSGYFDGGADYLTIPGTDFTFAGDFTIEFSFQLISWVAGSHAVVGNYTANAAGHWMFAMTGSTSPIWYVNGAGTYVQPLVSFTVGTKYKIALVRKNGTCTVYINGVATGTPVAYAGVYGLSGVPFGISKIGGPFTYSNMYFDQLRISDVARYSADYTPL